MKLSHTKRAVWALILANMIWGAAPPIFKWSLEGIPLYTLGFIRFIIPAICLFIIADKKDLKIQNKDFRKIFYMGYCVITVNILFFFLGLERTVSVDASVIGASGPICLMLGSLLILHEKVRKKVFIGNMIGFVGVMLIILEPLLQSKQAGGFIGNIFLLSSTIALVIGTILAKELAQNYKPITLTFWSMLIGAFTFAPFFIAEGVHTGFPQLTFQGIIGILFGSFISSMIAYFLYFWSLKYFPASEVGVFTYIDMIVTILIAIPLLHESITSTFLIGAFLIFFGIYIAERRIHYHPIHRLFGKD